jgi:peptide/nickel transport system permease protein
VARIRFPFRGDRLARIAFGVLLVLVTVAVLGPLLPVGSADAIGAGPHFAAPSLRWLAGTDDLGRPVLPRLVEGVRTTFVLATLAVAIGGTVGVVVGVIAAYYGGVIDELIARCADILFAFPSIIFALLLISIVGPGEPGAVLSVAVFTVPLMVRVVRAASLQIVGRDYVTAAKVGGVRSTRVMLVHVLPNVAGVVAVQGTFALSTGMLIESALSFLGLGVQPPAASLGSLVSQGSVYLSIAPWLVLIPGGLLALAVISVNLVGDSLRDLLDVRAVEVRR